MTVVSDEVAVGEWWAAERAQAGAERARMVREWTVAGCVVVVSVVMVVRLWRLGCGDESSGT